LKNPDVRPIRLLLVDCQRAVRRGLKMRFALEPNLKVVGEAGDAVEAIPLARTLHPDVILMDVEFPGVSGTAAIETLSTSTPHSGVVIFTLRNDAATRGRARAAGAAAFVAKHQTEETLLAAIRGVATEQLGRGGAM
jgi:two-component system nitrate/nitrite response regulator NarL